MGFRNLKAIAVRGKRGVEIVKLEEFLEVASETSKMLNECYEVSGWDENGIPREETVHGKSTSDRCE